MTTSIGGQVNAIIADVLDVDESRVMPGARLQEELGADGLAVDELIKVLEDEFGIELGRTDDYSMVADLADACKAALRYRRV